uniref:Methyltransferase domain-containing protein n=1 Tax=Pygocentrus nattereri TaxID=42514 RepID=A0AAR2KE53_PYGNA
MADTKSFTEVKKKILSAHENVALENKLQFYNTWAENYEQDVAVLEYRAPLLAAECVASFFKGDKERALVLDVACGTGLVSAHLRRMGFCQFVGVDGSDGMLDLARKTGLYQELKQCILGQDTLPVQNGDNISGRPHKCFAPCDRRYVCMTTRGNADNQDYKTEMERMVRMMEEEKRWSCVTVNEVEEWERAVSEHESGYISGTVYLYQRTS